MSDFRSFLRSFQVRHQIVKKHNRMVVVITVCTLATGTLLITGDEQYVGNMNTTAEAKEKATEFMSENAEEPEILEPVIVNNAVVGALFAQNEKSEPKSDIETVASRHENAFLGTGEVKTEIKQMEAKKRASQIKLSGKEVSTLERIVEAEAGDQDIEGRMLVANVILNRTKNKEFPNDVCGVVHQHSGRVYQFSPCLDGSFYRVKVSETSRKAVQRVLAGEDESQGALYFVQRNIAGKHNLSWFDRDLQRLFQHGCHTFYK